jgi:RNA polymerase sigma-70 factor (ECF subfamily)
VEDKELLDKLLNPESKSSGFNMLVRAYQQKIYWHIRKMVIDHDDADDLTQEVFIKVYKNIGKFRQDARLFTWIYRIATNECLNFLQRKRRKFFLPIGDIRTELQEKLTSADNISGDEIQLRLQNALLALPDKQRLVFNMRYFDQLPYEEMAAITGTSVGALKASYHHAAKKIEEILKAGN